MNEKIKTQNEFESIINRTTPQLIVFVKNSTCPMCIRYIAELEYVWKLSFYIFDIKENESFYTKVKLSLFVPESRVYKNGMLLYCRGGHLFLTQINEMLKFLFDK